MDLTPILSILSADAQMRANAATLSRLEERAIDPPDTGADWGDAFDADADDLGAQYDTYLDALDFGEAA